MKTIVFQNNVYRIKREKETYLVCQRINEKGEDTGYDGTPYSEMLSCNIWKNSGTRIISKNRL